MTTWSNDEPRNIAEADDLHISAFRQDRVTYGTPTWIGSVAVAGALYVRAYNGQNSRWYQAAVRQKAGLITAAGATKEITFEPVEKVSDESRLGQAGDAPLILNKNLLTTRPANSPEVF